MYRVYQFLERQLEEGRQAYVVFPMIEESEEESMRTLDEGFRRYSEHFAQRKIVRVHGKMKPDEKDEAMRSSSRAKHRYSWRPPSSRSV